MNIAIKQRFYPTPEQELLLAKSFGCVRVVWNHVLKWRTDCYYNEQKSISYAKPVLSSQRLKSTLTMLGLMKFLAFHYSKRLGINKQPLETSSISELTIQRLKRKTVSSQLP